MRSVHDFVQSVYEEIYRYQNWIFIEYFDIAKNKGHWI